MESKFYIGQRVVAIRNHRDMYYKKGDIYVILNIKKTCCASVIKIKDNSKMDSEYVECHCGSIFCLGGIYVDEKNFAPVQEQQISNFTFEEAIELVTVKQLENI